MEQTAAETSSALLFTHEVTILMDWLFERRLNPGREGGIQSGTDDWRRKDGFPTGLFVSSSSGGNEKRLPISKYELKPFASGGGIAYGAGSEEKR